MTPRRYYCLKRIFSANYNPDWEGVWQGKQLAEPGTDLPTGFPSKSALEAVGYVALEDIQGADETEIQVNARISLTRARAVIAALPAT